VQPRVDRAADGGGGVPSSATIASAMTAATAAALALTLGLAAVSGVVAVREMNGWTWASPPHSVRLANKEANNDRSQDRNT
jgi:hypothetical protein